MSTDVGQDGLVNRLLRSIGFSSSAPTTNDGQEQTATPPTVSTSERVKNSIVRTFRHDPKEAKLYIEYFNPLLTAKSIPIGTPVSSSEEHQSIPALATAHDFLYKIDLVLNHPYELFNLNTYSKDILSTLTTFKEQLEKAVTSSEGQRVTSHDQNDDLHLVNGKLSFKVNTDLKALTVNLTTALQRLRSERAGFLNVAHYCSQPHPLLLNLSEEIVELHRALLTDSESESFKTALCNVKKSLSAFAANKNAILGSSKLSEESTSLIERFSETLDNFQALPRSLKLDKRFNPSVSTINRKIQELTAVLEVTIGEQESRINSILRTSRENALAFAKSTYNGYLHKPSSFPEFSPVEVLTAAISYFDKQSISLNDNEVFSQLLEECESEVPNFQKDLQKVINSNRQLFSKAKRKKALKKGISFEKALKNTEAFSTCLEMFLVASAKEKKLYPTNSESPLSLENVGELFSTAKSTECTAPNSIVDSVSKLVTGSGKHQIYEFSKSILTSFLGSAPQISSASIMFLSNIFGYMLDNDALNHFISGQTSETQIVLKKLIFKTKESLAKVSQSPSLSSLKAIFKTFNSEYEANIFSIDGVEIPLLINPSNVKESKVAVDNVLIGILNKFQKADKREIEERDWEVETNKEALKMGDINSASITFYSIYAKILGKPEDGQELDEIFCDIMQRLESLPPHIDKKVAFKKELYKEIDKRTDCKLITRWIAKGIITFLYPFLYSRIHDFTSSLLVYVREKLSRVDYDKNDEFEQQASLLNQVKLANDCLCKYQNMLVKFSGDTVGGDKTKFIEEQIKLPQFNDGFSETDIEKTCTTILVDQFLKGISFTEKLDSLLSTYRTIASTKVFKGDSLFSNIANKVCWFTLNAFPLGLVYVVGGVLHIGAKIIEAPFNFIGKQLLKQWMTSNHTITSLVSSAQKSIYYENPYLFAINQFLAEQLEDLNNVLDGIVETDEDIDLDELFRKIPPATKEKLTSLFKSLFELMDKDKFLTQETLKKHLESSSIGDKTSVVFDDLILPSVIESLIQTTALASHALNHQQFERQLTGLLLSINEASISPGNQDLTSEEKLQMQEEFKQTENKIKIYLDKILRILVKDSVAHKFDTFGTRQHKESEKVRQWAKITLLGSVEQEQEGLVSKWRSILEKASSTHVPESQINDHISRYNTLKKLFEESKNFVTTLANNLSHLKESLSERAYANMQEKAEAITTSLNDFLNGDSFIILYKNERTLYELLEDRKEAESLAAASQTILDSINAVSKDISEKTDSDLSSALDAIFLNQKLIKIIFSNISLGNLNFIGTKYTELNPYLSENEIETKMAVASSLKRLQKSKDSLKAVSDDLIESYTQLRIAMLNGEKISSRRVDTAYNHLYEAIQNQNIEVQHSLKLSRLLNTLHYSSSKDSLLEAEKSLKAERNKQVDRESFEIKKCSDSLSVYFKKINQVASGIKDQIDSKYSTLSSQNNTLLDLDNDNNLFNKLDSLRQDAEHFQPMDLVQVNLGVLDKLKSVSNDVVYSHIRPKADSAIKLLKDANFGKFLLNSMVFVPFIKEHTT